jgi:hypothetical protein
MGIVIWNAAVSTSGQVIKSNDILEGINLSNELIPSEFKLEQNYPNPFNPMTIISFSVPNKEYVSITLFNSTGELVSKPASEMLSPGNYTFVFDASNLSSGTYFCRMIAGSYIKTNKMILIK